VAALLAMPDLDACLAAVGELRRPAPSLEAAEFFFDDGLRLCEELGIAIGAIVKERASCYLLVELAATYDPTDELAAALEPLNDTIAEIAVADDHAGRRALWRWREALPEAVVAAGVQHKIDVALPPQRVAEFDREIRTLVRAASARVISYGHLADGNVHVNLLGVPAEDLELEEAVVRRAAELGGTVSAEHGVGIAKTAYVELVRTAADLAAMRAIKQALDPQGLLNPGAVLG
jgi:FAD/FMN-containing dehydrogenase